MGFFNPTSSSIDLKVVYYGPAFGGKTTNLGQVQRLLADENDAGLLSVCTENESTLFFDYLPLCLRLLDRYSIRIQGYTVPGQPRFNATRKLVLEGVDGVVFVADSRAERHGENIDSLLSLHANLTQLGLDAARMPLVLQYNKRDCAGALDVAELDRSLNEARLPRFEAIANRGAGVVETFESLIGRMIARTHEEFRLARHGIELGVLEAAVADAFAARRRRQPPESEPRREVVHIGAAGATDAGLFEGAVEAGVGLARLSAEWAGRHARLAARSRVVLEAAQRVVHDLRKPLTALKSALYLLEPKGGPRPEALAFANEVIASMVAQLEGCGRELHQLEEAPEAPEALDAGELVEDVLRCFAPAAAAAGVELQTRVEGDSAAWPRLTVPREGLRSVLGNLVGNAIHYSDAAKSGRRLVVRCRSGARGVLLAVHDNGIGIPDGERRHLMRKYARASNGASRQGTGLGLYLASEVVRSLGGRMGLRAREGEGCMVWVLLPPAVIAAAPVSRPETAGAAAPAR